MGEVIDEQQRALQMRLRFYSPPGVVGKTGGWKTQNAGQGNPMELITDLIFQLVSDGQQWCKDIRCWLKRALEEPAEGTAKSTRMGHHPLDHCIHTKFNTIWCCLLSRLESRN